MPIDRELLGSVLRQERERRQLSQEALAALSGLSRTHVGEIERGLVDLSLSSLVAIADGLGMSAVEILNCYERRLAEGS